MSEIVPNCRNLGIHPFSVEKYVDESKITGVPVSDGHLARFPQYRVKDHPYHAPQFIKVPYNLYSRHIYRFFLVLYSIKQEKTW